MALRPELKVDTRDFVRAMREYRRRTGDTWEAIVRNQTRGVVQRLLRITWPRSKKQGEIAVARDAARAAAGVSPGFLDWLRLEHGGAGGGELRGYLTRADGTRMEIDWDQASEARGDVESHHEDSRDGRGRVRRPSTRGVEGDRWREADRIVTSKGSFAAELRERQARVGMARGGFAAVLVAMGGRAAAWIRRWSHVGSFRDFSRDKRHPRVIFENRATHAAKMVGHRMQWVINSRVRDMERDMRRRLGEVSRRF